MAIYHCSVRVFSRAEGHSAVAAAAYRAGAVLHDERRGFTHRYHQRTGVVETFIMAPAYAPELTRDRALLWNAAEAAETRKNARVAREVILALPYELDLTARKTLARDMAAYLVERYRVAVDVALHSPPSDHNGGKDGHDPRNHHAHLLFTTREVTKDGLGKKTRILDDKEHGPQEIEAIRAVWEALANAALEQAGFEARIDRRTLMDQGIDRIPEIHIGPEGKAGREERASHHKDGDQEDDGEEDSSSSSSSCGAGSSGGQSLPPSSEDEDEGDDTEDEGRGDQKSGKQGSGDSKAPTPAASKEAEAATSQPDELLKAEGQSVLDGEAAPDKDELPAQLERQEKELPEGDLLTAERQPQDKGRKPDYPAIEQKLSDLPLSRAELVAEIKRINKLRAQHPPEPLPLQIEKLEQESRNLDRKVRRYERLLSQTSLPQALMHLIREAVILSSRFIKERLQGHARISFSHEERHTRAQRQLARYGQSYRLGIHEQMQEMKDNLYKLESTTRHLRYYRQLVERIERELKTLPSLLFKQEAIAAYLSALPAAKPISYKEKLITNTEVILKTSLRADLLREQIPPVYRPESLKAGSLREGFKASSTMIESVQVSLPFKAATFQASHQAEGSADQPSWKIKAPQEIRSITAYIQNHHDEKALRRAWFTPATDKIKTLQESIDSQLPEARERVFGRKESATEDLKTIPSIRTLFNAHRNDELVNRQVKNSEVIDKIKAEAQRLREIVPEQYRREGYESDKEMRGSLRGKWAEISSKNIAELATVSTRCTMTSAFNSRAGNSSQNHPGQPMPDAETFDFL